MQTLRLLLLLCVCASLTVAQEVKPAPPTPSVEAPNSEAPKTATPATEGPPASGQAAPAKTQPAEPVKEQSAAPSPYRFFSVVSDENLTEKLNQYGASGYRFLAKAMAEGGATSVVMETATGGPYQYASASGAVFKQKLAAEMNELGGKGYRYVPQTLRMTTAGGVLSAPAYAALMEKSGNDKCEYRLPMPTLQSNLKKDIANGLADGFRAVAVTKQGAVTIVILERCSGVPKAHLEASVEMYRVVSVGNMKEREKKIAESTAEGYRIVESNSWRGAQSPEFVMLLERAKEKAEYKYLVNDYKLPKEGEPRKDQFAEFEKEMNETAGAGFRLVESPEARAHHTGWSTWWSEMSALLVKAPTRYEYRIISEEGTPALSRKLAELRAQGFRVLPMGLLSSDMAIVERALVNGESGK